MNDQGPQTRKERKQLTRAIIRQSALELIAEKGFAATQIGDIVKRAGVAHGTFYVHYQNKEEVLDEILREFNQGLVGKFLNIWQQEIPESMAGLLQVICRVYFDHWDSNRLVVRGLMSKFAQSMTLENLRDGVNPEMIEFLRIGLQGMAKRLGQDPKGEIDVLVQGILSMWLRITLQVLFGPGINRHEAETVLVKMTMASLESVIPGISKIKIDLEGLS
jgi:AcrR family transcriptional regulator